jgi:ribose 1,5-bisphosphokinase PhnN
MPYLRFKGFDEELLRGMLPALVEEFSRVAAVPQEVVKIELLRIVQITATPRSLEIFMFPRGQEKTDSIAATLHTLLSRHGCRDVHIFFVLLTPSLYYKEGMPLHDVEWLPVS